MPTVIQFLFYYKYKFELCRRHFINLLLLKRYTGILFLYIRRWNAILMLNEVYKKVGGFHQECVKRILLIDLDVGYKNIDKET